MLLIVTTGDDACERYELRSELLDRDEVEEEDDDDRRNDVRSLCGEKREARAWKRVVCILVVCVGGFGGLLLGVWCVEKGGRIQAGQRICLG